MEQVYFVTVPLSQCFHAPVDPHNVFCPLSCQGLGILYKTCVSMCVCVWACVTACVCVRVPVYSTPAVSDHSPPCHRSVGGRGLYTAWQPFTFTFKFTFREFRRRFYPKRLTISTFVMRSETIYRCQYRKDVHRAKCK